MNHFATLADDPAQALTGFRGDAYRWLVRADVPGGAVRCALRDVTFERTAPLLLGLASTIFTGVLVFVLTGALWPILWIALDGALVALRYRFTREAHGSTDARRTQLHAPLLFCGLAWSLTFGMAAGVCVRSGMPALQMLAAANISGAFGAVSVRNAATPRYGALAMTFLSVPPLIAVALLRDPGTIAVAAILPLLAAGMYRTLLQNHAIMIRMFGAELKAAAAARTDAVTGLPNRTLLGERLSELTGGAQRARLHDRFSVLYIDLDRFKAVNDRHGHAAGDALLRQVAQRLARATRGDDLVCRTGGDEFVVVLPDTSEAGAARVAARIVESIAAPFDLTADARVSIGASVGGVTASARHESPEALLAAADRALYAAKDEGRGRYVFADAGDACASARG